jgi:hypothetical protein
MAPALFVAWHSDPRCAIQCSLGLQLYQKSSVTRAGAKTQYDERGDMYEWRRICTGVYKLCYSVY